jgi:hypothetical protein
LTVDATLWDNEVIVGGYAALRDVPAPAVDFTFHTDPLGESAYDALVRFDEAVARVRLQFHEILYPVPAGRRPGKEQPALERYAAWLCQHCVEGKSLRAITREHFGTDNVEGRLKDVSRGVERANELLGLVQYEWTDVHCGLS